MASEFDKCVKYLKNGSKEDQEKFKEELKKDIGLLKDKSARNNTLLHYAIRYRRIEIVRTILTKYKDDIEVLAINDNDDNIFHTAAQFDLPLISEILFKNFEHQNLCSALLQENKQGLTPLVLAAKKSKDLYKKFTKSFFPGYSPTIMNAARNSRLKKLDTSSKLFFIAAYESFCPSISITDMTEFVFKIIAVGAALSTAYLFTMFLCSIAVLGFSLLLFSNYKHAKLINESREEIVKLNALLQFFNNIEAFHTNNPSYDVKTVQAMVELLDALPAQQQDEEQITLGKTIALYSALGAAGNFICAFTGVIGAATLGWTLVTAYFTVPAALCFLSGPPGWAILAAVALTFALTVGAYSYYKRQKSYEPLRDNKRKITSLTHSIYNKKDALLANKKSMIEDLNAQLPATYAIN